MTKTEELEAKIRKVVDTLRNVRRENQQLLTERDSLKSHVVMLTGENNKAQRILADYEQLRKKNNQVAHKIEHALASLTAMRPQ